jgi:hypothetical protein
MSIPRDLMGVMLVIDFDHEFGGYAGEVGEVGTN